jgi:two-component system, NarL family, response regulator
MPTNQNTALARWRKSGRRIVSSHSVNNAGAERIEAILHGERHSQRKSSEFNSSNFDAEPEKGRILMFEANPVKRFRVLVADDHPVVREGLILLLEREPDLQVIAQASNGREAVEEFVDQRPDVALVDLRMPVMDGIETVLSICERDSAARIGIITSYQNEEDIYRALRAGALGFVLKDATPDELSSCVHALAQGKTWIPPQVGAMLAKRVADRELTRRETDVLRVVAEGKSNKEIGLTFNISEATVKVHITHILEKLRVTGRTEAINVAARRGLVRLDMATAA